MAAPNMVDHALAWAGRGFPVFPLPRGRKHPPPDGWQGLATTDPETIRRVWGTKPYNIGVLATDIIVDIDDKGSKTGSADWELLSYPDNTLTVGTPSGGRHLYYKSDGASGQGDLTKSINIRAAGLGYVVGPGSVVDGKTYTILRDVPLLQAPESLVERCQRAEPADRAVATELDTDAALERATAFLEARRPAVEGEGGDLWTLTTANCVIDFGISADMCHDLMLDWNDRCSPPWEIDGPGSLRTKVDSAWKSRLLPPGSASPEAEFSGVSIPPPQLKARTRPKFLWIGDKSLDLSQQWLMYNRFPRVGTAAIVGPSNSGKTFLALDLGAALGSAKEWLGKTSDEKVGTIILTAEGIGGLPARMAGYDDEGPVVATTVKLIKDNPKQVTELLEEANGLIREKGVRLGLIVLDTLTASGLLENENDNSEIGRALNYLEQMAMAFECLVMVTHHPPKVGSGMRGGYALHAGFDVVAEIFQQGNQRFVECTKNRDGPTGAWGSFVLSPHTIAEDFSGKGRDVTTQHVVYGTESRNKTGSKNPPAQRMEVFFEAFFDVRAALKLDAEAPVPLENLSARFRERVADWKGSPMKSFKECFEFAKINGSITVVNESEGPFIMEASSREVSEA